MKYWWYLTHAQLNNLISNDREWRLSNVLLLKWCILHCVPKKTCDHVFDDKLKYNCPFTKIFGTLIAKGIGHRQVFLFSHLTYLVQLLYLEKLSKKLNKIMKISP